MEQLQGLDATFLALERPNSPMHIGSILIYDPATAPGGFVRFKDILAFMGARMHLSKTMRQRLVKVPFGIDYPYWMEDPDFDLEYHVRHLALPQPGDWRQLCIQTARIFARPLDLTRPPWEFTIIGGLDSVASVPRGSFAMVTKVHHSAIDGLSGIDLMSALHTQTPSTAPPNEPDMWEAESPPHPVRLFARGYMRALINPVRQVGVAVRSTPGVFRTAKGLIRKDFDLSAAASAPRTRFNGQVSPHRVVEGRTFALVDIKALRKLADGAKVNDVFLSIIGGALRKYLLLKEDLPERSLTAMAPISVRDANENSEMGNQVAAMIAPLGTHIDDAAERLEYVHLGTSKSKAMTHAMGARQMTEASKISPALFMSLGARLYSQLGLANRMKPVINTVVTNVPGPPVPIYSSGARLISMHGLLCLFDGVALGHVVQSYVDKATIGFTACRKVMPDPEIYADCLQASFEESMQAAGLARPKRKSASVKKKAVRKSAAKTTAKKPAKRKTPAKKKPPVTKAKAVQSRAKSKVKKTRAKAKP